MGKLNIAKNKSGGYYSKIINNRTKKIPVTNYISMMAKND